MTKNRQHATPPVVSIGLPVYNGETFLGEAIDSLLAQTFTDFEIVISDNASTDGTRALCHAYVDRDSRIRYVRQAENRGSVANFQLVLDEARGKYFMWAACDDTCEPEFIERLLQVLETQEDIVLVMSDVMHVTESGSPCGASHLENIRVEDVNRSWASIRPRFFENPTTQVFFAIYGLFRIAALRRISLNYYGLVKYASGSELPLLAQVATIGKIASIPGRLKTYRIHKSSVFLQEQLGGDALMRLRNLLNVSSCLAKIAVRSTLPFTGKVSALAAVVRTGTSKIGYFVLKKLFKRPS